VRLIADDAAQQVLPLARLLPNPDDDDDELLITSAEVAGAYVLLLLSDGAGILLQHIPDAGLLTKRPEEWQCTPLHLLQHHTNTGHDLHQRLQAISDVLTIAVTWLQAGRSSLSSLACRRTGGAGSGDGATYNQANGRLSIGHQCGVPPRRPRRLGNPNMQAMSWVSVGMHHAMPWQHITPAADHKRIEMHWLAADETCNTREQADAIHVRYTGWT
jgi:hypothetical protein